MSRKHRLALGVVATDTTFERTPTRDGDAHVGKCIHCGAKVTVALDGTLLGGATLEHIQPRAHEGGDDIENLAIACARCNAQKGVRHDSRRKGDPKLVELVARLLERRRSRMPPRE
jgi:5-methylcytosine-specific restriction endonuclease McrA